MTLKEKVKKVFNIINTSKKTLKNKKGGGASCSVIRKSSSKNDKKKSKTEKKKKRVTWHKSVISPVKLGRTRSATRKAKR